MRKLLALLKISAALSVGTPAVMAQTSPPLQRCVFDQGLEGDGSFFLKYARDSWSGKGMMNCTTPDGVTNREMTATFNSGVKGYGVNNSSHVHIRLSMVTTVPLAEFRLFAPVTAQTTPGGLTWTVESGNVQADVLVMMEDPQPTPLDANTSARASLERGTLVIY